MKHTWLVLLALAGLLLNSAAGLAYQANTADISATAATVVLPWTVRIATPEPTSIDPAKTDSPTITNQLFSGLTRIDPDTNLPIADLASSWSTETGATQFTFTLRTGLTWSNGTPLTAYDVKYGILRSLDSDTGSESAAMLFVINNAEEYHNGTAAPNDVGITVLSDTELSFMLTGPTAHFPAILAMPLARPVPAATIATWGSSWTESSHIVTSGPYRMKEWVHNDHMQLDKFNSFYDEANVQIEHVYVKLTDEMTAWNSFLSGSLDTATVPLNVLSSVQDDPELSPLLHDANSPCTYYYGFSIDEPPFDELLVRKAFIAAVNRQGLIDAAPGSEQLAQTFTPPGVFGYVDGITEGIGIPYNPVQAQQWLEDAGYPDGVGLPAITLWYNTLPGHQSIAEYIQQNWEDNLNVTVSLQHMAWSDYLAEFKKGDFQIWRLGWCIDYYDAYNFLYDAIEANKGGYGGWSNSSYQNLLGQAAQSTNDATRQDYYEQAEEILVETDAVMLPLYFNGTPVATRSYLERPYNSQDLYIRDWQLTAPQVKSIDLASDNPTSANSVDFTVMFSELVSGVDKSDFVLTATGNLNGYAVVGLTPQGDEWGGVYTVTVNPGFGSGTLRLDVKDSGTGIIDDEDNLMYSGFIDGEKYTVNKGLVQTSQASYDGWILESSETSGVGGTKNNKATTLYIGDDAANKQYRSILSFDTSSIPDLAKITKVNLSVRRSGVVGGGNPINTFKGIWIDIKEGNFGTVKLATGDFKSRANITYGPFKPTLWGGWYTINLTSGKDYINLTGNTQMRLRFKLDDNNNLKANYLKLYSGNAPATSRPKLIVEYYLP